ncbi:DUF3107 domain-containing protein [Demequina mangrovi]|uniref:ATP-binding protein n=1 Tax=Demequina mangrovi TaxID=1043493 RepID=A0A1H6X4K7_9MICO|nr:DUF3107 domain-containing protein [Demequina mangrovi]SEJ19505.1 Protein of unknown function [Demequina mangrovi]
MEIRIGVQNVSREIAIDTDMSADAVTKAVATAVGGGTLDITDAKGRRVIVPGAALGYVDIGEETKRRVGFEA